MSLEKYVICFPAIPVSDASWFMLRML